MIRLIKSEVTPEYLQELKDRLHILHNHDDDNLTNTIRMGHVRIQGYCGDFPLENEFGRDLVFEYCRFVYNNQTEWFYQSFRPELITLQLELLEIEDDEVVTDG